MATRMDLPSEEESFKQQLTAPVMTKEGRRAWEEALDALEAGDVDEQRETLALLKKALDDDRPGQRRVFGPSDDLHTGFA